MEKNVLIVDDCEDNIFILRTLIKVFNKNINVITACNGEDAMSKFNSSITHIIMDYDMPGWNGIETLKKLSYLCVQETGKNLNEANIKYCIFTAGLCEETPIIGNNKLNVFHKPILKENLKLMLDD
jgi:CheY-like chemotaxis protein